MRDDSTPESRAEVARLLAEREADPMKRVREYYAGREHLLEGLFAKPKDSQ